MKSRNCKLQNARPPYGWCPKLQIVCACVLAFLGHRAEGSQFSFDDIVLWFGSGTNRAALVVDWSDSAAEPQALAWGYRWNGAATGANLFASVVAGDPRLFAKIGGSPASPSAVYGIGYDANADHNFGIDDGTTFDSAGFAPSGPADGAIATDSNDYYAEGWFTGFWHYGISSANPYDGGAWSSSTSGMGAHALVDGEWNSWTFSPTFNFAAFAENPTAALPYPGDFNVDGQVDGLDYTLWRNSFGSNAQPTIDANRNGIVDAADYVVWRMNRATNNSVTNTHTIPEPTGCLIAATIVVIHFSKLSARCTPMFRRFSV